MQTHQNVPLNVTLLSLDNFHYLILASSKVLLQHSAELEQDERIKDYPHQWQELVANFEKHSKSSKSTSATSLSELDKQRDGDLYSLKAIAKLASKQRHAGRRQAGQDILDIIQSFGDLTKRSHSEQSVLMISLIKQLESRENRAKLSSIGGMDYFSHLKESHDQFEMAYMRKMEEKSQGKGKGIRELRRELETSYRTLYTYLLCLEYFGKDSYHTPLLAGLNKIRMNFVEKQKKKPASDKKGRTDE